MVRLRTVEQAYQDIKAIDKKSSITRNYIRSIANSGKIPVQKSGRKLFVNMDSLEQYLEQGGEADGK